MCELVGAVFCLHWCLREHGQVGGPVTEGSSGKTRESCNHVIPLQCLRLYSLHASALLDGTGN